MFFIILQLHNRCGYTASSLQSSPLGNNGMGSHSDWFLIIPRLWLHADNNKDINFNWQLFFSLPFLQQLLLRNVLPQNSWLQWTLRIIMNQWWKENFQVSQDTFEFILNMKAVILNRFKSGNPPTFLNFRAVTKARVIGLPWLLWVRVRVTLRGKNRKIIETKEHPSCFNFLPSL